MLSYLIYIPILLLVVIVLKHIGVYDKIKFKWDKSYSLIILANLIYFIIFFLITNYY